MCDDIFDDNGDDYTLNDKSWNKTIQDINKDGYRAGLDRGQEECLQEGFNQTFALSAPVLAELAALRGCVSGKLSLNLMKLGFLNDDQEHKLQELLGDILQLETQLMDFSTTVVKQLKDQKKIDSKLPSKLENPGVYNIGIESAKDDTNSFTKDSKKASKSEKPAMDNISIKNAKDGNRNVTSGIDSKQLSDEGIGGADINKLTVSSGKEDREAGSNDTKHDLDKDNKGDSNINKVQGELDTVILGDTDIVEKESEYVQIGDFDKGSFVQQMDLLKQKLKSILGK